MSGRGEGNMPSALETLRSTVRQSDFVDADESRELAAEDEQAAREARSGSPRRVRGRQPRLRKGLS